ncbi:Oxidized purine nucleoside triphosphate hydrolase [Pseudolycoriella hygida]|uniref:Oxidized purine nucleoside triphosphate hydrolase n=1 Tax=Pseudolycoriella hygida TaxID=35572 RepID=A0A9Q0MIN1_9DIPT|nr:Oxidized purine nucleoside triphosphate hydrolase [Pseudolycoriella hygida]
MESKPKKLFTLVFVYDDHKRRLLLGLKKRGFGSGKYNGFGGKVEANESIKNAAIRELSEECGLNVRETAVELGDGCDDNGLTFSGINFFNFVDNPIVFEVHIFKVAYSNVKGIVTESDEMRPQWFGYDEIPYDQMWPDDRHWFPSLFKKDVTFTGCYVFESIETDILLEKDLREEKRL